MNELLKKMEALIGSDSSDYNKGVQDCINLLKRSECEHCEGYGTVHEDVFDPDSGQMMRGVGKEVKCVCQLN